MTIDFERQPREDTLEVHVWKECVNYSYVILRISDLTVDFS